MRLIDWANKVIRVTTDFADTDFTMVKYLFLTFFRGDLLNIGKGLVEFDCWNDCKIATNMDIMAPFYCSTPMFSCRDVQCKLQH